MILVARSSNPIVFIVGPTASGKSSLALEVAQEIGAGIVNSDSLQVYQKMDIGTAKPTVEERSQAPHYLFDLIAPGKEFTAGKYRELAFEVIESKLSTHPLFFVGGSGFYIQALEKGMFSVKDVPSSILDRLKLRLESEGLPALYGELVRQDSQYSEKVSPNDSYRILRALGVIESEGKTMTEIREYFDLHSKKLSDSYPVVKLGLSFPRDILRQRVRDRCLMMLDQGWIKEVQFLLDEGWKSWPPMKSVGYAECISYLEGSMDKEEMVDEIVKNTMRLAKRQMTWFRRDSEITWFDGLKELNQAREFLIDRVT